MSEITLSVTNFVYKLVVTLFVLWVAHLIDNTLLSNLWVAFTTAVIVGLFGVFEDIFLLPQVSTGFALGIDFIITTVVIFFIPLTWHGTKMTFVAAVLAALVITFFEITLHQFLRRTEYLLHRDK